MEHLLDNNGCPCKFTRRDECTCLRFTPMGDADEWPLDGTRDLTPLLSFDMPSASEGLYRGTILVVDAEAGTRRLLADVLGRSGYHLLFAGTGGEALDLVSKARPDLLVVEILLPDMDGLLLCTELKRRTTAPILICSASSQRRDRVLGLRLGADDFLAKPFSVDELEARIDALLRRAERAVQPSPAALPEPPRGTAPLTVGALQVHPSRQQATLAGQPLSLTPIQYRLLRALASHPSEVVTYRDLVHSAWPASGELGGFAIATHMARLRRKLTGPSHPAIRARRGFGYMLTAN